MSNTILVLNSGSSSLKFALFAPGARDEELLLTGSAEGIGRESGSLHLRTASGATLLQQEHILESQPDALSKVADAVKQHCKSLPTAVAHRVVHGGPKLIQHQHITPEVLDILRESIHFAPVHIPQALTLIQQAQTIFPGIPHYACFDTVFHQTMPATSTHFALPEHYFTAGLRRYGFHGLSYESLVHRLGASLPSRAIFAHLGNGASVTAVRDGRSFDTSMGLTPTGGIIMGTRSGDLDPGVLLYLMRNEHLDADALEQLLNRESGLAGISGGESDMQALLQRASTSDAQAQLAIDCFCASVRKYIGAYAASMGGVDLLVFTGGIGQHSQPIRERILEGLECLGLTEEGNPQRVLAMPSEEEIQMARITRALINR